MEVFNPRILDACIRDVTCCLTPSRKVDVLLDAIQRLPSEVRSRNLIENAVQSCLQLPALSAEHTAKARLLRCQARMIAGNHFGAQDDLKAVLIADPDNVEATELLHQYSVTLEKLTPSIFSKKTHISVDIWSEITSYLPRQDLRALLFVSRTISRISRQRLFQRLDLWFSNANFEVNLSPGDNNASTNTENRQFNTRCSADILTQVMIDPSFATVVRSLRVFEDSGGLHVFQTGMFVNALPKLINLRFVAIHASGECIMAILRGLQIHAPRLVGLTLNLHDSNIRSDISHFTFPNLHRFSYACSLSNFDPAHLQNFSENNSSSLRIIVLRHIHCPISTAGLSIRNLTRIHLCGRVLKNNNFITDILTNGHQLETLYIECILGVAISSQFRAHPTSLPFLRNFGLNVRDYCGGCYDPNLFPAVADFLRERKQLRALDLTIRREILAQRFGYDAAVWGLLPSLVNLHVLKITYPANLIPILAGWLVPRTVRALSVSMVPEFFNMQAHDRSFLEPLRTGIPPVLRYLRLPKEFATSDLCTFSQHGFPMIRVMSISSDYYTIERAPGGSVNMKKWPSRAVEYYLSEWLDSHGCEDAVTLHSPTSL